MIHRRRIRTVIAWNGATERGEHGTSQGLFARTYDRHLAKVEAAGLGDLRRRLVGSANGSVLGIGAGALANRHRPPPRVLPSGEHRTQRITR
jgi:hypothetical protein